MDKARQEHLEQIQRLELAIVKTKSMKLKSDYAKALVRMCNDLIQYDKYKAKARRLGNG
jgi:hypothetical protein